MNDAPEFPIPRGDGPRNPRRVLSRREQEVLALLARGAGTERIAGELFISPTTVRNHIENILHKLRVHSRLEAIITWMAVDH